MIRLMKSFRYAAAGIFSCIRLERNFRIHCVAALFAVRFSLFYGLSGEQYAVLALVIAAVLSAELINTAVERAVDMASPERCEPARIAKDCSAGAVLICAAAALCVAYFFFWDVSVFKEIFKYYGASLLRSAALIVAAAASVCFIFIPVKKTS